MTSTFKITWVLAFTIVFQFPSTRCSGLTDLLFSAVGVGVKNIPEEHLIGPYTIYRKSLPWEDAEKYCESKKGHLATFLTFKDAKLVMDKLHTFSERPSLEYIKGHVKAEFGLDRRYWIGLTDLYDGEGNWTWVTDGIAKKGQPLTYFDMWFPGQPDHVDSRENPKGREEHCGVVWNPTFHKDKHHSFADNDCKTQYYFICQIDARGSLRPQQDIKKVGRVISLTKEAGNNMKETTQNNSALGQLKVTVRPLATQRTTTTTHRSLLHPLFPNMKALKTHPGFSELFQDSDSEELTAYTTEATTIGTVTTTAATLTSSTLASTTMATSPYESAAETTTTTGSSIKDANNVYERMHISNSPWQSDDFPNMGTWNSELSQPNINGKNSRRISGPINKSSKPEISKKVPDSNAIQMGASAKENELKTLEISDSDLVIKYDPNDFHVHKTRAVKHSQMDNAVDAQHTSNATGKNSLIEELYAKENINNRVQNPFDSTTKNSLKVYKTVNIPSTNTSAFTYPNETFISKTSKIGNANEGKDVRTVPNKIDSVRDSSQKVRGTKYESISSYDGSNFAGNIFLNSLTPSSESTVYTQTQLPRPDAVEILSPNIDLEHPEHVIMSDDNTKRSKINPIILPSRFPPAPVPKIHPKNAFTDQLSNTTPAWSSMSSQLPLQSQAKDRRAVTQGKEATESESTFARDKNLTETINAAIRKIIVDVNAAIIDITNHIEAAIKNITNQLLHETYNKVTSTQGKGQSTSLIDANVDSTTTNIDFIETTEKTNDHKNNFESMNSVKKDSELQAVPIKNNAATDTLLRSKVVKVPESGTKIPSINNTQTTPDSPYQRAPASLVSREIPNDGRSISLLGNETQAFGRDSSPVNNEIEVEVKPNQMQLDDVPTTEPGAIADEISSNSTSPPEFLTLLNPESEETDDEYQSPQEERTLKSDAQMTPYSDVHSDPGTDKQIDFDSDIGVKNRTVVQTEKPDDMDSVQYLL